MNRYNAALVAEKEYRRLNPTERVYCQAEKPLLFPPLTRLASERAVVEKPKPAKPYFSPKVRKILLRWKKEWVKFCIIKWTGDVGNR